MRTDTDCPRRPSGSTRAGREPRHPISLETTLQNWATTPGLTRIRVAIPGPWVRRNPIRGDFMTWPATSGSGATTSTKWTITGRLPTRLPRGRMKVRTKWFAAALGDLAPTTVAPDTDITRVPAM